MQNNRPDFVTSLLSDNGKRRKLIEEASYMKKKAIIRCPTPPPPMQVDASKSSVGYLDVFPLELLHIVFLLSDLESLFRFRRLNRRARFLIDNWPVYSILLHHVPKALLTFSRTGAAPHFTAKQVKDLLYQSECSSCGQFGGHLYLPQCKRCCFPCLECKMQLSTITKTSAISRFGSVLSKEVLERMLFVSTVSTENSEVNHEPQNNLLASFSDLYAEALIGGWPGKTDPLREMFAGRWKYDARDLNHERYGAARQVAMPFPYLNRGTGICEYAICCRECSFIRKKATRMMAWRKPLLWEMEYSEEGFINHLVNCRVSWHVWENFD